MKRTNHVQRRTKVQMLTFLLAVPILSSCGDVNTRVSPARSEAETSIAVPLVSEDMPPSTVESTSHEQNAKCKWDSTACDPPCWEGIVPNETTLEQALGLLRENGLVERSTIREGTWLGGVWPGKTQILWNDIGWETSGDILISSGYPNMLLAKDGIVEWMLLRFDVTAECSPTVTEIIKRYGIPEKILRGEAGYTPEIMWDEMDLLYPSQGLVFAPLTTGHLRAVQQEDRIGTVYFFVPTSLDTLMAQPIQFDFQRWYLEYNEGSKARFTWMEELEDWPGFDR